MSKPNSDCLVRSEQISELLESDLELVVRKLGEHLEGLSEDMPFALEHKDYAREASEVSKWLRNLAGDTRKLIRQETRVPAFSVEEAKKLASENYETWGQWVVECFEDSELLEEILDYDTIEDWVDLRKSVASSHREIENTAW